MEDRKECQDGFDYDSLWNKEENKRDEKILESVSRGYPRIKKGKALKIKNYVGKNHVKYSYMRYVKDVKKENEME